VDINLLRAHRQNMAQLRACEPAHRFAYALYQAWCVGAGETPEDWSRLPSEIRSGWLAAADFSEMYTNVLEIDAIVRAL